MLIKMLINVSENYALVVYIVHTKQSVFKNILNIENISGSLSKKDGIESPNKFHTCCKKKLEQTEKCDPLNIFGL